MPYYLYTGQVDQDRVLNENDLTAAIRGRNRRSAVQSFRNEILTMAGPSFEGNPTRFVDEILSIARQSAKSSNMNVVQNARQIAAENGGKVKTFNGLLQEIRKAYAQGSEAATLGNIFELLHTTISADIPSFEQLKRKAAQMDLTEKELWAQYKAWTAGTPGTIFAGLIPDGARITEEDIKSIGALIEHLKANSETIQLRNGTRIIAHSIQQIIEALRKVAAQFEALGKKQSGGNMTGGLRYVQILIENLEKIQADLESRQGSTGGNQPYVTYGRITRLLDASSRTGIYAQLMQENAQRRKTNQAEIRYIRKSYSMVQQAIDEAFRTIVNTNSFVGALGEQVDAIAQRCSQAIETNLQEAMEHPDSELSALLEAQAARAATDVVASTMKTRGNATLIVSNNPQTNLDKQFTAWVQKQAQSARNQIMAVTGAQDGQSIAINLKTQAVLGKPDTVTVVLNGDSKVSFGSSVKSYSVGSRKPVTLDLNETDDEKLLYSYLGQMFSGKNNLVTIQGALSNTRIMSMLQEMLGTHLYNTGNSNALDVEIFKAITQDYIDQFLAGTGEILSNSGGIIDLATHFAVNGMIVSTESIIAEIANNENAYGSLYTGEGTFLTYSKDFITFDEAIGNLSYSLHIDFRQALANFYGG